MGDNRPAVYEDPEIDKWVFRASSLGGCFSHLVRCGLGFTPEPPPKNLLVKFAEGDVAEPVMLNWLSSNEGGWAVWDEYGLANTAERFGGKVSGRGDGQDDQLELEIPVGKNAVIRVHPDGIATCFKITPYMKEHWPNLQTGEEAVVECKAFGPDYLKKYKREGLMGFPFYAYQVSVEMAATGMPCLFVIGEKDEDGIVKPDKIMWDFYREPPYTLPQLKVRVMKILAAIDRGEIPPCDIAMFPCGFWQEHDTTSSESVWFKPEVVEVRNDELDDPIPGLDELALKITEGKARKANGEEQYKSVTKALQELVDERGLGGQVIIGKKFRIKEVVQQKKGNVDWKKLCEAEGISQETQDSYRKDGYTTRWFDVEFADPEQTAK